ncbi:MAG TPA: hypothetical protein PK156_36685 [Polyangium sp.]|nr:hypothetical protein [Polyangium sp.]
MTKRFWVAACTHAIALCALAIIGCGGATRDEPDKASRSLSEEDELANAIEWALGPGDRVDAGADLDAYLLRSEKGRPLPTQPPPGTTCRKITQFLPLPNGNGAILVIENHNVAIMDSLTSTPIPLAGPRTGAEPNLKFTRLLAFRKTYPPFEVLVAVSPRSGDNQTSKQSLRMITLEPVGTTARSISKMAGVKGYSSLRSQPDFLNYFDVARCTPDRKECLFLRKTGEDWAVLAQNGTMQGPNAQWQDLGKSAALEVSFVPKASDVYVLIPCPKKP